MKKIQTVNSSKNEIIVGRILPGEDLITGILDICEENAIDSGSIVSMIGSFNKVNIVHAISDDEKPMGISYTEPLVFNEPLELLSGQGTIGKNVDGERDAHIHGVMVNGDFKLIGGHFLKGDNIVLATVEITILSVKDGDFIREFDEETGFDLFKFYEKN